MILLSTMFVVLGCLMLLLSERCGGLESAVLLAVAVIILYGVTWISSGPAAALLTESVNSQVAGRAFSSLALATSLARACGSALFGLLFALNRQATVGVMSGLAMTGMLVQLRLRETLPVQDERRSWPFP